MRAQLKDWLKTRGLSDKPLCGEPFAKGDIVTFTNDYGVKFHGLRVIGFAPPIYKNSGTVYLESEAFWFPNHAHQLTKEA